MKKVLTGIATTVLAVSLCAATAFAAGPRCGHHAAWGGCGGCAYVDANWDGICDSCGAYRQYHHMAGTGCAYVDANGDGICDNCGIYHWGRGCGGHFMDANGDGVCDVCGVAHANYGGYFVDADGDGICDNYGTGLGRGCGHGHGSRCGRGW